ncbi:hypothetical protein [Nocardia vinacea]|uniref:hypothetical protein n=1 Tax=Nocardia vinacea TaxID=96468 RepID=UPI0002EAF5D7|nr:hypothetical protein [Nocardia vinacea]
MNGSPPGATGETGDPGSFDDAQEEAATDERPSYLEKSADSARMGKAAEYLVAAICILATRGQLNVSTTIVDDEGVDLVFHLRDHTATLAVQVKARMSDGSVAARGRLQAQIRQATFRPRNDLDLLFILVDIEHGTLSAAWLVPSRDFDRLKGTPTSQGTLRFSASASVDSHDKWSSYRLTAAELPQRIVERVQSLDCS